LEADLTGVIPLLSQAHFRHPGPDLVPLKARFLAIFSSGTGWNLCSQAGLFWQAMRGVTVARMSKHNVETEGVMLSWVITFLVVALIAGILGFGGIAGVSIEIAKTIFFIAVVLFLISAVVGLARGRTRI
jgi:uncharacterized membrane protein YtjA (UPF0391 family)